MDTEIRRYSYTTGCLDPDEYGDLCRYDEVEDQIDQLENYIKELESDLTRFKFQVQVEEAVRNVGMIY